MLMKLSSNHVGKSPPIALVLFHVPGVGLLGVGGGVEDPPSVGGNRVPHGGVGTRAAPVTDLPLAVAAPGHVAVGVPDRLHEELMWSSVAAGLWSN